MTKAQHTFKQIRRKTLPLDVETDWPSDQLLAAVTKNLRDFNQDMEDGEYVLLYPDGTMVKEIPGTETPFTIERYKEAIGKAYQRITLFVCNIDSYLLKGMSCVALFNIY